MSLTQTQKRKDLRTHPEKVVIRVTRNKLSREVPRHNVGGTGGEESLPISYNNHKLILLYLKIVTVSL